jgi:predicted lipoprotein with Yx(FWY)xxD motif
MAVWKIRGRGARTARLLIAAIAAVALVTAGLAVAKTGHQTLKTAHNGKLGRTIAVDSHGRTVYELRPETSQHLLCVSKACLQVWPPVKVPSAKAKLSKAAGIKGKLGTLHRGGFFQVTLGGLPLYRYAGDSASGQANGQGIKTFGGTWHVVTASSHKTSPSSTTTGSTTTTRPGYY